MLSLLVLSAGAVALAGCGGGDETSFSDDKIVEELKLEKAEDAGGYTIKDDPFCEIGSNLLNDSGEVDSALDDKRPVHRQPRGQRRGRIAAARARLQGPRPAQAQQARSGPQGRREVAPPLGGAAA